jgi:hypothetical protein
LLFIIMATPLSFLSFLSVLTTSHPFRYTLSASSSQVSDSNMTSMFWLLCWNTGNLLLRLLQFRRTISIGWFPFNSVVMLFLKLYGFPHMSDHCFSVLGVYYYKLIIVTSTFLSSSSIWMDSNPSNDFSNTVWSLELFRFSVFF